MSSTCLTSNCSNYLSGSVGQVFTSSIQMLFAAQCFIKTEWPPDSTDKLSNLEFDYIVVGAGTAGSVVAARLSEDSCRSVLVIEAGGDPPFESEMPGGIFNMQKTSVDWQYETESDPISYQGMTDSKCYWPAGKMLGGTSSMDELKFTRGSRKDYDDLELDGNVGWNYAEALKYFKKSEHLYDSFIESDPFLSSYHNYSGPLGVTVYNQSRIFENKLLSAYKEIGFKERYDINGADPNGVFRMQNTIAFGRRTSPGTAFLVAAGERNNFFLLKNTLVTKILIEGKTAFGVRAVHENGTEFNYLARREVILCAGTIRSPHILMLSGIGPTDHLQQFNISVIANLAVGQNLNDHVIVPVHLTIKNGIPTKTEKESIMDVAQYIVYQTGYYSIQTSPGADIYAYTNVDNYRNISDYPNIQFVHAGQSKNSNGSLQYCLNFSRYTEQICNSVNALGIYSSTLTIYPLLLSQKSRGNVSLSSSDPFDYPKIYANSFHDQEDVETLLKAINIVYKLLNTPSFKSLGAKLQRINITDCNGFNFPSREYWTCLIYQMGTVAYHSSGTVKMGPSNDSNAVVNPKLQVYGITNLRVVDASVIPGTIRGNIKAAVIMFAEKASDIIKEAHAFDICG